VEIPVSAMSWEENGVSMLFEKLRV